MRPTPNATNDPTPDIMDGPTPDALRATMSSEDDATSSSWSISIIYIILYTIYIYIKVNWYPVGLSQVDAVIINDIYIWSWFVENYWLETVWNVLSLSLHSTIDIVYTYILYKYTYNKMVVLMNLEVEEFMVRYWWIENGVYVIG